MEIPQEIDDYIKNSIDNSLGLPASGPISESRLRSLEESQTRLRNQYFQLCYKLKEKDDVIDRTRAEASMNAQALKKFVDENQKLAAKCANLVTQCSKWERECSLYDHDREALMDFGNEADKRAADAEVRVGEIEEELGKLSEELEFYKNKNNGHQADSSTESHIEENLLESVMETLICKDDFAQSARAFLEANNSHESFQKLLNMWTHLRPSTQKILSLAAEVKTLEKDKQHLRINLHRAEEEATILSEENNILDEENKRLLRQIYKERKCSSSGGKHTCSTSGNKRKSSPRENIPIEKMDFGDLDSRREALSPLLQNSPDSRMHKK